LNNTSVKDAIGLALYGVDIYPVRRVAIQDHKTGQWAVATEEPTYMVLGESSGIAAAMAISQSTTVQSLDINALRNRLKDVGQIIAW
jgi:hypothetical protein